MGYYVNLLENNAIIPTAKLDEAYKILCELNNHNELKRGGSGLFDERQKIEGPHEGIWFSWMEWNYPETCPDAATILQQVGLEFEFIEEGLSFLFYDGKTGCEDVFIAALTPVLESVDSNPPYFVWQGEQGETWRQIVIDGEMVVQEGTVVFS